MSELDIKKLYVDGSWYLVDPNGDAQQQGGVQEFYNRHDFIKFIKEEREWEINQIAYARQRVAGFDDALAKFERYEKELGNE